MMKDQRSRETPIYGRSDALKIASKRTEKESLFRRLVHLFLPSSLLEGKAKRAGGGVKARCCISLG